MLTVPVFVAVPVAQKSVPPLKNSTDIFPISANFCISAWELDTLGVKGLDILIDFGINDTKIVNCK